MPNLIEVQNLKKYFLSARGTVHAVDNVSFKIEEGKTLGLVGESGCGKSTLGRTLVHLIESTGGKFFYKGEDVTHLKRKALKQYRGNAQIIFQDPFSSLNPKMTVRDTIQEPLILADRYTGAELEEKTQELMDTVGIENRLRFSYPHELDGGRRQRVGIARALAVDPEFIVCDEPVSALDVSIQAQVLNLLMDLQDQRRLTYLFVTHDMSVVYHISHHICVMYLGEIVESCSTDELFERPLHPYTKALLSAVPTVNIKNRKERVLLSGETKSPIDPKPGCRFSTRCRYCTARCAEPQILSEVSTGHFVACSRVANGEIDDS